MTDMLELISSEGTILVQPLQDFTFPVYIQTDIESIAKSNKTSFFSSDEDNDDTHV